MRSFHLDPTESPERRPRRTIAAALAVSLSAALTLAACGDADDAVGLAPSAGATLKGEPIVIGVIGDDSGTVIQNPSGSILAKIAAERVNSEGGIDGRPLKIVTCDAKSDPQAAAVCARKLLQDEKAVVLAGNYTTSQGAAIYPALEQANTVSLFNYPSIAADQQSPLSYPALPGTAGTIGLIKAIPEDASTVAVVHFPSTAGNAAAGALIAGLPDGVKGVDETVQLEAVDYQPTCLSFKDKKVDAVAVFVNDGPTRQLMQTCQQLGIDVTWLLPSITQSEDTLKSISDLGVDNAVAVGYAGPLYDQMLEDIKKFGPAVGEPTNTIGDVVVVPYLAVILTAKVLNSVDTIDGPSIKAFMDKQSAFETGMTPPLDFTKPGPIPTMPRVVNTNVAIGSVKDGKLTADPDSFVSFAG